VRHPSHYFIKYLLVAQEDLALDSLNSTLALHGMAPLTSEYLQEIRAELGDVPEDFRPWDRLDRPTNKWLRKQKIFSLVHPDLPTQEMKDKILEHPRMRRDVESLILGNVSIREASFRLQKLGKPISDLAIAEYRHYFWNTEVMGIEDWADYFVADEDLETGTGRTAISSSLYNAALHAGPEVALYRIGVRKELNSQEILIAVQQELYHTFLETRALPLSPKKVEMLSALSRGLARIDERIQAGDQALQDVLKRFEKFRVLTDNRKPPKLADLAPTGSVSNKSRDEILMTRDN
jgi:hypothetical protein